MASSGNKSVGIGSLISLLSKSDIRYEGILYSINLDEKNIALKDVQSFGTENRTVDVPVPPSAQQYNLIVFKGDDIKDLNAIDTRCPIPASGMQASRSQGQGGSSNFFQNNVSQQPQSFMDKDLEQSNRNTGMSNQNQGRSGGGNQGYFGGNQRRNQGNQGNRNFYQNRGYNQSFPQRQGGGGYGRGRGGGYGRGGGGGYNDYNQGGGYRSNRGGYRQGGGGGRGRGGNIGGGMRGGNLGVNRQNTASTIPVPKEDFDFQQALDKFNKDEIKKEMGDQSVKEMDQVYKKDDFFDEISCEALEKQAAEQAGGMNEDVRRKMQEQRKLDMETFGGVGGARYGRGRGRGRGRGGGRGTYGGGRGGRGGMGNYGGRGGNRNYNNRGYNNRNR
eukprot:TRINITY_DN2589_c0_g2_i2.p1 TRINITY_DN2589_c0_g2~~TRINITY_DN2589_c0_g2_i2.p1  ORF type:complete len:388 (+),score=66.52 TRINITY_DN2589_c0_g2_i2:1084-2247(+)